MSIPLPADDPAQWMLQQGINDPSKRSTSEVFDENCYICKDPEFALMGLPLCYPCPYCSMSADGAPKGHVPADDTECTVCGEDVQEYYMNLQEKKNA